MYEGVLNKFVGIGGWSGKYCVKIYFLLHHPLSVFIDRSLIFSIYPPFKLNAFDTTGPRTKCHFYRFCLASSSRYRHPWLLSIKYKAFSAFSVGTDAINSFTCEDIIFTQQRKPGISTTSEKCFPTGLFSLQNKISRTSILGKMA